MPTQNVNLSKQQSDYIRRTVDRGDFRNASEVVRAGLRLLQREQAEERVKLKLLRQMVQEGFDAIDGGRYTTVTPDTLDVFMDSVSGRRRGNDR